MEEEWERFIGSRANFRTKVDDLMLSGDIQKIDKKSRRITFYGGIFMPGILSQPEKKLYSFSLHTAHACNL